MTLKHLFRIQVARVHEYVVYYNFLKDKYIGIDKGFRERHYEIADFVKDNTKKLMSTSDFQDMLNIQKPFLSPEEKLKLLAKFNRMINAKQAFENVGGKYHLFAKRERFK